MSTALSNPVVREPSLLRINAIRVAFFLNFAFLGFNFVTDYRHHPDPWQSGTTVAFSLWGMLAVLSAAFGLRHPLKMVPLLLAQLTYKVIWILAFYLPGIAPAAAGLAPIMIAGVIADVIFIPWSYVFGAYVLAPSERWR
jgi:hypothetical protein